MACKHVYDIECTKKTGSLDCDGKKVKFAHIFHPELRRVVRRRSEKIVCKEGKGGIIDRDWTQGHCYDNNNNIEYNNNV